MSRATPLVGASKTAAACLVLMVAAGLAFPIAATAQDATPAPLELRMQAYSLFPGSTTDKAKAVELFKQAAEAGDGEAMAFLGSIYLSGDGVAVDRAEAINWYLKAAQTGHAGAIAKLAELAGAPTTPGPVAPVVAEPATPDTPVVAEGAQPIPTTEGSALREQALLLIGRGEPEEGFGVMLEAAKQGDVEAMANVGIAYLTAKGTERNKLSASEWLKRAADGGDIFAMVRLAELMMVGGIDLPKDDALAEASLRNARVAIEQLDFRTEADRLLDVADYLVRTTTLGEQEYGKSLLRRLAAAGSASAMLKMAEVTSGSEHVNWLQQAAEAGDAVAMRRLSQVYTMGNSVPVDLEIARDWMARSAAAGDEAAINLLAAAEERAASVDVDDRRQAAIDLYRLSDATPEQLAQARQDFEMGVADGDLESSYWLADMLMSGTEEEKQRGLLVMTDYVNSGGDEYGMSSVARAYENGIGTDIDLQQALEWYERATAAGYEGDDDIARVSAVMNGRPLPGKTLPPTDRWGPFMLDGDPAVGISSGEAYFAFGCLDGSLYLEFDPGAPVDANISGLAEVLVVLNTPRGHAYETAMRDGAFFSFTPTLVDDWMNAAAAANSVELGLTGDLKNFNNYDFYNATTFSALGSSAAIRDLRATCTEIAAASQ